MLITFARSTLKMSLQDTKPSESTSASPLRCVNDLTRYYSRVSFEVIDFSEGNSIQSRDSHESMYVGLCLVAKNT